MEASTAAPPITDKFRDVISELKSELVERQVEADLLVRSIIARTNLLLIGDPGTAKSLIIREFMSHIEDGILFELLLAKDTPSEQVLGPVSLGALERDEFLRITSGKLPEAQLGFLDEIFKANSTVLNALLKIINERKFDNNGHSMDVPLWCVMGASNELPGPDRDDLRAFRDRFGATKMVDHVRTSDGLQTVIDGQLERNRGGKVAQAHTLLTPTEVEQAQQAAAQVDVPQTVKKAIVEMRNKAEEANLTLSVRRLFEGVKLMQAGAYLEDRDTLNTEDLTIFEHVLWSDPEDHPAAYEITLNYAGAVAKKAARHRSSFEELQRELTELQGEMPTDGSTPQPELFGKIGSVNAKMKKLGGEIESAIASANDEGHATAELDQLLADIKVRQESIRKMIGIGT
jgi:MoxR-like ATPase